MIRVSLIAVTLVWVISTACVTAFGADWSQAEIDDLRSLWIGDLEPLPSDPSNRFADDPKAAALGERFFFDTRLSSTGTVSCATCHLPDRNFQDGRPLAVGVGTTTRRTMPVAGTSYSPFLFWDGRKDSQWAQALGPLESPVEHGGTRAEYAQVVASHYRAEYEAVFGRLPVLRPGDRDASTAVFVNIGKAIAAYERQIQYGSSRFDAYVEGLVTAGRAPAGVLTPDEIAGLRLFIGKANCTQCHNGPLFTNHDFHNTGVPAAAGLPEDAGRLAGARAVRTDEFNCRSRWSDARAEDCTELQYVTVDAPQQRRAFKVPSLRNVAERAPYMHAGQIATLADVLAHYNRAPAAPAGKTELKPLKLTPRELGQLQAFLGALSSPVRSAALPSRQVTDR